MKRQHPPPFPCLCAALHVDCTQAEEAAALLQRTVESTRMADDAFDENEALLARLLAIHSKAQERHAGAITAAQLQQPSMLES